MKYLPSRRVRLVLGLLAAPPLLWALILLLVPTDWARNRLVDVLARSTGQPARLETLRLGAFGGVRLEGLELGRADPRRGPWLRVDALRVDLSLTQLATGHLEPGDIEARGITLRLHRRADGSAEFLDLIRAGAGVASENGDSPDPSTEVGPRHVPFRWSDVRVTIVDEPSGTLLDFTNVQGRGRWDRGRVEIEEMAGGLNGGRFEFAALFDHADGVPTFDGQLRAQGVALDARMDALGYLVPILAGRPSELNGKLDLTLYLRGQGANRDDLLGSLVGQGAVALDPIGLAGTPLGGELATVLALSDRAQVGSARSTFTIQDQRISTRDLTLRLGSAPITLAGWTDFAGRLDYRMRTEGLTGRLPSEARKVLADLPIRVDDLMELGLSGTMDHLEVTLDGAPLTGERGLPTAERAKLKQFGQRLKDRLLR